MIDPGVGGGDNRPDHDRSWASEKMEQFDHWARDMEDRFFNWIDRVITRFDPPDGGGGGTYP